MALSAYRQVLRATRIAFKDDTRILLSARQQARTSFSANSSLLPNSAEAETQIAHAEGVAKVLRQNVIQGEKVEVEGAGEKYKLRIHDETEKGDNETIRKRGAGGCGAAA